MLKRKLSITCKGFPVPWKAFGRLLVFSRFFSCVGWQYDRPCTQEEVDVLYAIALGDTLVLDTYLKAHGIYDFECRDHDDFLRGGDSMVRQLRQTKHASIYRTYFKYPLPQAIKDELLYWRMNMTSENELLRILLRHGAKLEYFSTECQDSKALRFLRTLDTLSYDFQWISPTTGNNILMDYCACTDRPAQFQEEFKEMVRFLVKKGVRTDIKNHQGETAIDIAERTGEIGVLREAERMKAP